MQSALLTEMVWEVGADTSKVQYLWIQSKIKDGDPQVTEKVLGTNNVADVHDQGCRSMVFGQVHAAMKFTLMCRSRGQSISRSIVCCFATALAASSFERLSLSSRPRGGVKILPMR